MNLIMFIMNKNRFDVTVRMDECRICITVYSIKLAMLEMEIFKF
jgi:hypothetical protein